MTLSRRDLLKAVGSSLVLPSAAFASARDSAPPQLLDPDALLKAHGHAGDDWLARNIPFFECPDRDIESIYYYRWWSYHKNIRQQPESGRWAIYEGGPYGITPCPLGHHLYEGRWIKDPVYLDDYCRMWFELITHPAQVKDQNHTNPRGYSNWLGDACHARYLVSGDQAWARAALEPLQMNFAGWEQERFDSQRGLFRWVPDRDGMEASLAGFEEGEANQYEWKTVIFGGEGYRPSLNSYLFADARAIASIARLSGDNAAADAFAGKASALKNKVQSDLWDADRQFFIQRRSRDGQFVSGREEIGFFPWAFHLPDDAASFAQAWKALLDPQGFKALYGPTTLERRNRYFLRPFNHPCLWNGPSWPYSTSLTLAALANLLNDYHQDIVRKEDYVALLRTFAATHRDPDGSPMVREDHHPDENRWLAQAGDYNHSRYCDLVITGLVGLRPRSDETLEVNPLVGNWDYFCLDGVRYHGRNVAIVYDRTGKRYGKGAGLRILIDGSEAARAKELRRITVRL